MNASTLKTPAQQPDSTAQTHQGSAPNPGASTPAGGQGNQDDKVQMTMDEWKRTHRDFKTCNLQGEKGRWVMRMGPKGSTLYPVEIVK
jgi:hypothetical protein